MPNGGPGEGVHALIAARWSPRGFEDRSVAPDVLRRIFEAGRWAASAFNEQPWRWLVATREDVPGFAALLSALISYNQEWARHAPVLAISLASTNFARNGKANRHAGHDVGQAAANLALEAVANGLFIHQMAGFDAERVRTLASLPPGIEPMAAIAIGYPGPPVKLSDALREKEAALRERSPLRDVVFGTRFGEAATFLG